MNEAVMREKLDELCKLISQPCRTDHPRKSDDGFYISNTGDDRPAVEKILENLRLQIKYITFDLEATRRENFYLRRMLESRPKPHRDDGKM